MSGDHAFEHARLLQIPVDGKILNASITVPPNAAGLVLFAHGSGSGRHSPRNRRVAEDLNNGGLGTVLTDLLTDEEAALDARTGEFRFDIELLSKRLTGITDWLGAQQILKTPGLGYFGASTGAAAALTAAAERPEVVQTVVSRGGRPDLAGAALHRVKAPCLFIVGEADPAVLRLNRHAISQLPDTTKWELAIIPEATHLFEEPGTLDQVSGVARRWFQRRLRPDMAHAEARSL